MASVRNNWVFNAAAQERSYLVVAILAGLIYAGVNATFFYRLHPALQDLMAKENGVESAATLLNALPEPNAGHRQRVVTHFRKNFSYPALAVKLTTLYREG